MSMNMISYIYGCDQLNEKKLVQAYISIWSYICYFLDPSKALKRTPLNSFFRHAWIQINVSRSYILSPYDS